MSKEKSNKFDKELESSDTLMRYGFLIVLLNMSFGFLPITVEGSSIKYFFCSITQLYAVVFAIIMLILSLVFVLTAAMRDLSNVVGIIVSCAHVLGFLFLITSGRGVAKRLPIIWDKLSNCIELCSQTQDVKSKDKELKKISWFVRCSIFKYLLSLIVLSMIAYMFKYKLVICDFIITFFASSIRGIEQISSLKGTILSIAYVAWSLCSSSHILVSMILTYYVKCIKFCLRCMNNDLKDLVKDHNPNTELLRKIRLEEISKRLKRIKCGYALCEEITTKISQVYGPSMVIEVVVLLAMLVANIYLLFTVITTDEDPCSPIANAVIHFYFFYALSCETTAMTKEAARPLQILKNVNLEMDSTMTLFHDFKLDVANCRIDLTAADYAFVNKNLIATMVGATLTYLIVLIQFVNNDDNGKFEAHIWYQICRDLRYGVTTNLTNNATEYTSEFFETSF